MGARLNWIMHFGLPPRFNKNVRIVQLDISPEAIGQNVPAEVALVGDGKAIVGQLNTALEEPRSGSTRRTRPGTRPSPQKSADEREADPADDRRRLGADQLLPRASATSAPGSRRTRSSSARAPTRWTSAAPSCPTTSPRTRLDAGTYGTMGVGMGFAHGRRRRASGPADRFGVGRLGDRLLRHGDGDGLPPQACRSRSSC